jgi:hypothetical protein
LTLLFYCLIYGLKSHPLVPLQFAGCGETGAGEVKEDGGQQGGEGVGKAGGFANRFADTPLLDYSDDEGTVTGEEVDENVLNSDDGGSDRMDENETEDRTEDRNEDGIGMDVDGQGNNAAAINNEVFQPPPPPGGWLGGV